MHKYENYAKTIDKTLRGIDMQKTGTPDRWFLHENDTCQIGKLWTPSEESSCYDYLKDHQSKVPLTEINVLRAEMEHRKGVRRHLWREKK